MEKKQYRQSVYREYFLEASCLYDQRRCLLNDPEYDWPDPARVEIRLVSHIDALAEGGEEALAVCAAARSDDEGALHAALRVFCRQGRFDLVQDGLAKLDPRNAEALEAAGTALAADMPSACEAEWLGALCAESAPSAAAASWVIIHRRLDMGRPLRSLIEGNRVAAILKVLIRAAGRTPSAGYVLETLLPKLHATLEYEDAEVRREAALALLRLGDPRVLDICRAEAKQGAAWPCIPLGLAGEQNDVALLLKITARQPSPDGLTALGWLGDIRAVPPLLKHLAVPAFAEAAAQSLWLMTGADLCEEVFIPVGIDPNILFEDELEQYKKGEFVLPGNMRGSTFTRISQSPAVWQAWWTENEKRFDASVRYRSGAPCLPATGLAILANPKTRRNVRDLAADELAIRYGVDIGVEADDAVARQREILAGVEQRLKAIAANFEAGAWYFGGGRT